MEKHFFQTESLPIDLAKYQERCGRQGLLLCILSIISFFAALISIVVKNYNVIYTDIFSVVDGCIGVVVGGVGYYTSRSNTYSYVNNYKMLAISYSILYLISKGFSGALDISDNPSNVLLIILFVIIFLVSLPVCFYYSVSVALYAKRLRKYEKEPEFQTANAEKIMKSGSSSQVPLTTIIQ